MNPNSKSLIKIYYNARIILSLIVIFASLTQFPLKAQNLYRQTNDTTQQPFIGSDEYNIIKFNLTNVCPIEMVDIPERITETKTTRNPDTGEMTMTQTTLLGFKISKCEITQLQWARVMGTYPSHHLGNYLPVENVSYNEIQAFINKLNKVMGTKYVLPTENQWEYAAADYNGSNYYQFAGTKDESELYKYAWYNDNSGGESHKVANLLPNAMGLYDMTGNVNEWCSLCQILKDDKYTNENLPDSIQVIIGGSWASEKENCIIGKRKRCHVDYKSNDLGFRLVLEP